MDSIKHTNASSSPELESLVPPRYQGLRVPQHTVGATGRIWSLPAPYQIPDSRGQLPQFSISNGSCVANLIRFLQAYEPALLSRWHGEVSSLKEKHPGIVINAALQTIASEAALHVVPEKTAAHLPATVTVPTLNESHWSWSLHYELGHGKSVSDNYHEDCRNEALSDLGSMRFYLEKYRQLLHERSGERLKSATWAPLFNGPYQTCMEICLVDLKLPAHFISLIHHGIAVQFVHFSAFAPTADAVFSRLAEMHAEDFPR